MSRNIRAPQKILPWVRLYLHSYSALSAFYRCLGQLPLAHPRLAFLCDRLTKIFGLLPATMLFQRFCIRTEISLSLMPPKKISESPGLIILPLLRCQNSRR